MLGAMGGRGAGGQVETVAGTNEKQQKTLTSQANAAGNKTRAVLLRAHCIRLNHYAILGQVQRGALAYNTEHQSLWAKKKKACDCKMRQYPHKRTHKQHTTTP